MIIATVKIMPAREKRRELLDILQSVKGRVLAEAGCLCCCIYEEHGDENGVLYVEKWQSRAALEHNLKSSSFGKILEAIELSAREPEIDFHDVAETMGLELVERVRRAGKNKAEAPRS